MLDLSRFLADMESNGIVLEPGIILHWWVAGTLSMPSVVVTRDHSSKSQSFIS